MNHAAILILTVGLAGVTAACRPEKTTGDQRPAKSPGVEAPGLAPSAGTPMARQAPMDFSVPPGDSASSSGGGSETPGSPGGPTIPGKPGDLKASLADLDRVVARQKQVVKLWEAVGSVADARRNKQALLKGALDVLALTIAAMQRAVTLSKADLKLFLRRQSAHRGQARQMNEVIKKKQRQIMALPGGKVFFGDLKQSAAVEVRKQSQTLMRLGRKLLMRQKELKP